MAEAGPSSPTNSVSRHSRFPNDSESSSRSIGLGLPPPIFRTHQPATRHNRRRIKSDGLHLTREATNKQEHTTTQRTSLKSEKRPVHVLDPADSGLGVFSDEYDLSREDPGVMEDVQRAMKMKARIDARLKASSSSPGKESLKTSEVSPPSSFSTSSSPAPPSFSSTGISFPPANGFGGGESEVDFSPSISASAGHPVPRSTDDGATLDWSGDKSADDKLDRRWSLSMAKRKPKDTNFEKPIAENQGYIYTEKLQRIRTRAKPLTLRKASMTADQLQRRYGILYASTNTGPGPVNLASVIHWHSSQDASVRAAMERSEPSTWLKHLEKKPAKKPRLPWNVTALIVEEYMKAQLRTKSMQTIPEDSAVSPEMDSGSTSRAQFPMPTDSSPQHSGQRHSYESSPKQRAESGQDSLNSRQSETSTRPWLRSLQSDTDSQKSSIYSVFKPKSQVASPTSSRLHIRDFALRRRSDELSSLSEGHSQSEDGVIKPTKPRNRPSNIEIPRQGETGAEGDPIRSGLKSGGVDTTSNLESIPTARAGSLAEMEAAGGNSSSATHENTRNALLRRVRMSLPSSDRLLYRAEEKRQQRVDEERERQEYEVRAQLLDSAIKQNHRIRQILQRVTAEVREFEGVQTSFSALLGVTCLSVPPEVLDAFSHDPSAVTGSTRRLRGYKAVEDIQARIVWQRDVLQSYIESLAGLKGKLPLPTGIFDESITALMDSVSQLEKHRHGIIEKAEEVTNLLAHVRELHATVKADFNETLIYTSQIYPEIAQLSTLEEAYRNKYQQLYDFGMDALTFLLDSVTPFWRTYGKTIGVDVQDFLIIPWYRNEFTGELKRYSIKRLPRRSFRHWLGLLALPNITFGAMVLQGRGALYSFGWSFKLLYFNNPGLWYIFLPLLFLAVIIQWAAVLIEFCIILAELGVAVWWMGWTVGLLT